MNQQIHFRLFSFMRTISISKRSLRFVIIITVMLASLILPYWGSPILLVLLLILLGGVAGFAVLLRQPNVGFVIVFLSAMFVHYIGPGGVNAAALMVAMMMGLWLMDMFIVQRHFQFVRSQPMTSIVTFLVISTLAFFVGQIPWFIFARQAPLTAQIGGYAIFLLSIGGLLLAAHLIKDLQWLKALVWIFLGLAAFYVIGRTLGIYFVDQLYHFALTGQSMFWTWIIALAASQVIYNDKLTRVIKGLLISLILLTLYVAIGQAYDWKSGWVPPLVVIGALLAIRYRKLVVFALPFVMAGLLYAAMDLIAADEYSWGTRVDAWKIVLEIGRASPLLGTGFANYYWYTPLFPIRGYYVSFNSHSQFIDLIAQTGYLGLLGFFWVFFELGRLSWKLSNALPDGFARAYAYGVFAGIVASIVAAFLGDWVLPFVYNVGLNGFRASILAWIFMGGVISLEQMFLTKPAE
ncbi:MAG: O-antigen ligase family protein [Anaerolineales bacterium]